MMVGRLGRLKTIRAQLMLGFGVILLLHGLSAAIGYGSLQRLRHRSQAVLDDAAQVRELSLELQNHFLLARQAEEAYFEAWQGGAQRSQVQNYIDTNQTYLTRARQNLAELQALAAQDEALTADLALLDSLFRNYESAFETTVRRIEADSLTHPVHQQLQDLTTALPSPETSPSLMALHRLVWQVMAQQQAYLNSQSPAYLNDLQVSLDRLTLQVAQLPTGSLDRDTEALLQTYMATLKALLLLDQQVQVNRIVAANINRDINDISETMGDRANLLAAEARNNLAQTAQQSAIALGLTALTALTLAIGASLLLGRRIMTPLSLMTAAAERIARQDLSQPLTLSGDNEFSAVAHAFNHMVSQLRQVLETLEQRVDERTEALASANQTLQAQTQSLEALLQKLRRSEADYRLLVDYLQAGVVVHTPDTTITMCNRMGAKLLGMATDEAIGQAALHATWPLINEAGQLLSVEQYPVNQVLATGQPMPTQMLGIRHSEAPGDCAWVLVNAFPTFDENHQLTQVVVTFIDISDRRLIEEELRHQALHDALTGLPNRTLFTERLDQAIQRIQHHPDRLFAVLFIDLDRFKIINDSLGHLVGDQLLIQIAQLLQRHVRPSDTVARLGGDEFVILLEPINQLSEAIQVVERLQGSITMPFTVMGHTVFTSASLGIALASPHYSRGEDMLRDADNAMYRAKKQGQASGYVIFDPAMHESAVRLFELETHLRQAIDHQDFVLHYQPIIRLADRRLLGFEALVRWVHPQRGLIAPSEFIPLAEETGLIIPLSEWIFAEACRQLADWQRRFPVAQSIRVSVNVAAAHFEQPNFCPQILEILATTGLSAHHLKLEMTESLLLTNVEEVLSTLSNLQRQGIEISIDDFGTGYSSLSYLKRFPINTLKIDQSFVKDIAIDSGDISIVKAIVQIAQSLGMTVVAEGVEVDRQAQRLAELGCDAIQGHWAAAPLTPDQAEAWLQAPGHSPSPGPASPRSVEAGLGIDR